MKQALLIAGWFLLCLIGIWIAFMALALVLYKSMELLQWLVR